MDLKKIQEILNSDLPRDLKADSILMTIAKDRNAVPFVLQMLQSEREESDELINDINAELSRSLVTIEDPNINTSKAYIDRSFVIDQIKKFYLKWQDRIKCCFKIEGLP